MEQTLPKKPIQQVTKAAFDIQEKRILVSNKITQEFRKRRGISQWDKKDPIYGEEEDPKSMETLVLAHKGGTETGGVVISQEEKKKIETYLQLKKEEEAAFLLIAPLLEETKVYQEFLSKEKGITLGIMGILIGWFDIHRAPFPSSFWSYAGLNPPKKAEPKKFQSLDSLPQSIGDSHNPYVKAKLISSLSRSLIQENSQWRSVFTQYKTKAQAKEEKAYRSQSHLHNMAVRYTVKEFLKAFHLAWRQAEGLPEPEAFQRVQSPEEMEEIRKKAFQ